MPRSFSLVVIAVVATAGCSPLFYGDLGGGGEPSPAGSYTRGRAVLTITDRGRQVITLDRVAPGPHLYTHFGAQVQWYNHQGWGLTIMAPSPEGRAAFGSDPPPMVQLDRVTNGSHWTTDTEQERCVGDVDRVDASVIKGTAVCKGLRWTDVLRGGRVFLRPPRHVEGVRHSTRRSLSRLPDRGADLSASGVSVRLRPSLGRIRHAGRNL